MNEKTPRQMGIELLRILSMFMAVILHILGRGGILANLAPLSAEYHVAWFLEIAFFCAVNCFALITGYVSANSKFNFSRLMTLWMQIIFYSILIFSVYFIFTQNPATAQDILTALFPVSMTAHWYVTAYFGMFLFIPIFNKLIHALTKRQFKTMIILLVLVFSIWPTIAGTDLFHLENGYSCAWLIVLYFIGAYMRMYGLWQSLKKREIFFIYLLSVFAVWTSKIIIQMFPNNLINVDFLLSYTSPFILLSAVALLALFARLKIKNKFSLSLIGFFAPLSFGVYLIHTSPLVFNHVLNGLFTSYSAMPCIEMMFIVFLSGAAIFIGCSFVDYGRGKLFKLLKLDKLAQKANNLLQNW